MCVVGVAGPRTAHLATLPALNNVFFNGTDPGRNVAVAIADVEGGTAAYSRGENNTLAYLAAAKEKREAWVKRPAWKGGPTVDALQSSLAAASPASARLGAVVAATTAVLRVQTPLRTVYGSTLFLSLKFKVSRAPGNRRTAYR